MQNGLYDGGTFYPNANYRCIAISCSEGERYLVNCNTYAPAKMSVAQFYNSNNQLISKTTPIEETTVIKQDEDKRNQFMEQIKKIEDEETTLLKLQKQYRNGEIKEESLTDEQVSSLCKLYDKQISNLKKSNEIRKQKLLEHRRRLQTDN